MSSVLDLVENRQAASRLTDQTGHVSVSACTALALCEAACNGILATGREQLAIGSACLLLAVGWHGQVTAPGDTRSIKAACASLRDEDAKVRLGHSVPLVLRRNLFLPEFDRQLAAQALGQLATRGDSEVVEMLLERIQAP